MPTEFPWDPSTPHPLAMMRNELVWEGKYDEHGERRHVDAVDVATPLEWIESVDGPPPHAGTSPATPNDDDFRNRLVCGDNKPVMAALRAEFKGCIDLVYIDPPFGVGADFTMKIPLGDGTGGVAKHESTLEMVAYKDTWGKGADSYLHMMFERLSLMKELLSDEGSILVHVDWRVAHWMQLLLDEVFGLGERASGDTPGMRNEIIWGYGGGGAPQASYQRKHDNLFWYSKGARPIFNVQRRPYSEKTLQRGLTAVKGPDYELHEEGAQLQTWWTGPEVQKILSPTAYENLKFPTQKPESLLERIIRGHSNPGDLVADFFCGSGTTGAVAQRLGRRWIMTDLSPLAIHTARKRLIQLQRKLHAEGQPCRSFDIYHVARHDCMPTGGETPPSILETAALEAEPLRRNRHPQTIDVKLTKFVPSLSDVPAKDIAALKARAVRSSFDFIDFWAIDFDWRPGQPFRHDWQDFRTPKRRSLKTISDAGHIYAKPGRHTIGVKVIDVFAQEITIAVTITT